MTKNWMRMINSAQRVIRIETPKTTNMPGLKQLTLDIQGLRMGLGGQEEFWAYCDMAEYGQRRGWCKPLSFWQRVRREQTPIGWLEHPEEDLIHLSFWGTTPLTLVFNQDTESDGILWRESEIMVMSAGFHFLKK